MISLPVDNKTIKTEDNLKNKKLFSSIVLINFFYFLFTLTKYYFKLSIEYDKMFFKQTKPNQFEQMVKKDIVKLMLILYNCFTEMFP